MTNINLLQKSFIALGTATAIGLGMSAPAEAALLNFTYNYLSGDILSGTFDGELQADNDTFFVDSILAATYNGSDIWDDITTAEVRAATASGSQAKVSLSGLVMDVISCNPFYSLGNCNFVSEGGFLFLPIEVYFPPLPASDEVLTVAGNGLGESAVESYSTAQSHSVSQWTASIQDVPTPAAVLPVLSGLLAAARCRKNGKVEEA